MLDYHVHVVAHGEYEYTDEWLGAYLKVARQKGVHEIGLAEHDEYVDCIDSDLLAQLAMDFSDILIRKGLEVDYIPGREQDIQAILNGQGFDYVIGSVHFINGWGFDHPDYKNLFNEKDIDEVYADYFALVGQAAATGFFDIIGHIDLVKIWGHRPAKNSLMYFVEPVLKRIKAANMVIEINSAGLRKPVGEIYPQREIVDAMFSLNIPITLGSDAHHPEQLGEGLDKAVLLAKQAGYRYAAGFDQRRRYYVDLR